MRQIHLCAWLLLTSAVAAACGGEKFSTPEQSSEHDGPGNAARGGSTSRNQGGSVNLSSGSGGQVESQAGTGAFSPAVPSAGGTASGGNVTTGGTAGGPSHAGSSPQGGSADEEDCVSASIAFHMLPSPDLPIDFLCDAGCGNGWLTITDAAGATAFPIFSACGATSCDTCSLTPCAAAACFPTPLTAQGSELVWNGTFLAKDSCGAGTTCQRPACVKPGKYRAKACAAVNGGEASDGGCMPKNDLLCAEAEFEFPGQANVKLELKKR
jgi:hypothetical protein